MGEGDAHALTGRLFRGYSMRVLSSLISGCVRRSSHETSWLFGAGLVSRPAICADKARIAGVKTTCGASLTNGLSAGSLVFAGCTASG